MTDLVHQAGIQTSPAALYAAIAEANGLKNWWSEHSHIEDALASVSFYNNMVTFKLRVSESVPNEKIVWDVEGGPPDWSNTQISWTISEHEGQTMLDFAHRGLNVPEDRLGGINYNWGWYVISLKFYLEKGKGMPHTDADLT
ncbi:MAG: SRPBCC domain-containing protein [Chloroflexota bacterium]